MSLKDSLDDSIKQIQNTENEDSREIGGHLVSKGYLIVYDLKEFKNMDRKEEGMGSVIFMFKEVDPKIICHPLTNAMITLRWQCVENISWWFLCLQVFFVHV